MAETKAEGGSPLAVQFDPDSPRSRSLLIRMFYPDALGVVLWFAFWMVFYVIGAWIVAVAVWLAFDLDINQRDAIASVLLVASLTIASWQQWSQSSRRQTGYGRLNLTLEPQGISLSSAAFEVRCRWSLVRRIEIRKDHLVLTYLDRRGVAIPRDAFGSEASLKAFAAEATKLKDAAAPRG